MFLLIGLGLPWAVVNSQSQTCPKNLVPAKKKGLSCEEDLGLSALTLQCTHYLGRYVFRSLHSSMYIVPTVAPARRS